MRTICQSILLGAVACAGAALLAQPSQAQSIDCAAVGERVSAAVKANPNQVLTVVEDALVAYAECACEVVTAAINSSDGSAESVKQIVLVAVQNAQTQAPAIAECAVAAAPEHAESVRIAFAEAFNGREAPAMTAAAADPQPVAEETAATPERTPVATASERAATEWTSGKEVVVDTLTGGEAVYGDPGYSDDYSGKAPAYDPGATAPGYADAAAAAGAGATDGGYFGAAPLTLGSSFLIPPVSASPIIEDRETEVIIKEVEKVRTKTRTVNRVQTNFVPRTVIRTVPVSPTS